MKTKRCFVMAASEIKTMLQSARKYPWQNLKPYRNQPINSSCKSIIWSPHNTSLHQRYLQADHNGTFQDLKKKNRKSLAGQGHIQNTPKNSRQHLFLKAINRSYPFEESSMLNVSLRSEYAPVKNSVQRLFLLKQLKLKVNIYK